MIIHREFEQQSLEWMLARSAIPTASEFDCLLTPEFAIRKGEMPKSYLAKKLAEKWQGGPLASFNAFDMEQGSILENEAIPWYELETGTTVERVGFITTDDGRVGCSPDGLLGNASGIEVKCPAAHTQTAYLIAGVLPKDYAAQVHGSIYVTGLTTWRFLSYRRHFPPLLLTVERDDKIILAIREALETFLGQFDNGWNRLCEINNGPPVRTAVTQAPKPTPREVEDYLH